ncbi:ATP-dependent Clp protease proteolytic subunit [Microcoleus sp. ARI1-B5]|uniref:ATP-dependent Clp protease proteolytic subunit n=1 Tax=unclassified Microcoleus TaxID=2642155 RepID=UPI002FD4DC41
MSSLIKKKHFRYFLLFSSPIFTGIIIGIFNPDRAMGDTLKRGEISLELAQAPNSSTTNTAICNSHKETIERLLKKRIVIISQPIDNDLARTVVAQLLYLDSQAPGKDIYLYINSPGGSVTSGMAIYDTMQSLRSDVVTVSIGLSASMGSILLAGGTKGKRFALRHSRIMIHQPLAGAQGQAADIEIQAKEILHWKRQLSQLLANLTGQPLERILVDTGQDFFMSAQEAKAYGIIDKVVDKLPSFSQP